jgi:NADP-dependent 3-hydroxy acid dehydrogenase YdfG
MISRNVGAATARLFAQNGAKLVLAGRTLEKLQWVAEEIENDLGCESDETLHGLEALCHDRKTITRCMTRR